MKKCFLLFLVGCCLSGFAQNVGIGTTTPGFPLTVIANAEYQGITQKSGPVEVGFYSSPAGAAYVQTWSPHDLNFATNNRTAKLTISASDGYVGINTLNPSAQLDINGSLRIRGNGAGLGKVLTSAADGVATWENASLTLPYYATSSATSAESALFKIVQTGTNDGAANFSILNTANTDAALFASTNGPGPAFRIITTGTGFGAQLTSNGVANTKPTLFAVTFGTGGAIHAQVQNSANNIANFSDNNGIVARINGVGKGFFNGGTQTGGADVAEAFAVTGNVQDYEPGDVLAISTNANRTVTKSTGAYSSLVVGVYATKPGVLLTERMENETQADLVPMGVIGVIPTKVCNEGGAIHRGDLLVTSSTPGCAMKGDATRIAPGMLLGKALEDFDGSGVGKVLVMVNVR